MDGNDLVISLLALLQIKGVGPGAVKKNFSQIHAAQTANDVLKAVIPEIDEVGEKSWETARAKGEQYLKRCTEVGIVAVAFGDPRYPCSLMELSTPPAVLFCRGELSLLTRPILGVIGTRKPNQFGETVAGRLGRHFSGMNVSLCNGLADGIDICSVSQNGAFHPGVIGVMACGLDLLECKLTSKRISDRADKLLDAKGLLVSEFPPGTVEDQNSVIVACRLQAGLSRVLVMVQSSSDGGSRFTTGHFAKLPRTLAFIAPPEAQSFEAAFGANQMLIKGRDGLVEFVGLKTSKALKAVLLPMRSRADYDHILRDLEGTDKALI